MGVHTFHFNFPLKRIPFLELNGASVAQKRQTPRIPSRRSKACLPAACEVSCRIRAGSPTSFWLDSPRTVASRHSLRFPRSSAPRIRLTSRHHGWRRGEVYRESCQCQRERQKRERQKAEGRRQKLA